MGSAIDYGLPYPKGLLLVGVQGTGKSLAAKVIAHEWNLPLLRLDFGRLFGSLLGQSESRIRNVIQVAEAFASSKNDGDNGTTNRVLSTFITWLAEKVTPVFVVATANNIEWMPPEVIRKGRFDEVFFLTLPSLEERLSIFKVHLEKARPGQLSTYQLPLLGEITNGFSGAEIEQVVIEAMRLAFSEDREFKTEDLVVSTQNLVPLSRTKYREIEDLQKWAESGNVILASD